MKKGILLFLCILFCSSLTLASTKDNIEKVRASWIGENIDNLINQWGYPTKEKTIAKKHLYIWESDRIKKYVTNRTGFVGDSSYYIYCDKIVEIDSKNNIVSMQFKGDNCSVSTKTFKAMANPEHNYSIEQKELKVQAKLEKQQQKQLKKEEQE